MEWITKILAFNKIPTRLIWLAWIISFLLLYLPSATLQNIGLTEFKHENGKYFGIIFLVSTGFLLIIFVTWVFNKINDKRIKNKYKTIIKESMQSLDAHEKAVLREFFILGKNTIKVPIDDPTVSGLIQKRILYQVGDYGQMSLAGMLFSHSIHTTARENMTADILDLPKSEPSQAEIERIKNTRPEWAKKLESRWF